MFAHPFTHSYIQISLLSTHYIKSRLHCSWVREAKKYGSCISGLKTEEIQRAWSWLQEAYILVIEKDK